MRFIKLPGGPAFLNVEHVSLVQFNSDTKQHEMVLQGKMLLLNDAEARCLMDEVEKIMVEQNNSLSVSETPHPAFVKS